MDENLSISLSRQAFNCTACKFIVTDLYIFHDHLLSHIELSEGSGYYYDVSSRSGHIKFSSVSVGCQTELATVVEDATQTDIDSNDSCLITNNATEENSMNETEMMAMIKQEAAHVEEGTNNLSRDLSNIASEFSNSTEFNGDTVDANKNVDNKIDRKIEVRSVKQHVLPKRKRKRQKKKPLIEYISDIDQIIEDYDQICHQNDQFVQDNATSLVDNKTKPEEDTSIQIKCKTEDGNDSKWLPDDHEVKKPKKRKVTSAFKNRRHARNVRLPFSPTKEKAVGEILDCHLCSAKYKSRWKNLANHIESDHDGMYQYSCKTCLIPFVTEEMMKNHSDHCKDSSIKSHACVECNNERLFISENHLKLHMKNNHDSRNPLKCEVCNVELMSLYHQRKHMVEHDPDTLKCSQCKYVAETVGRFDLHMTSHFRSMASYACIICNNKFANFYSITSHYYRHLDNEGEFTCEICGTSFACGDILTGHRRNCLKKYPCNCCDKSFARAGELESHINNQHREKATRPICDQCGASFSSQITLKRHVRFQHMNEQQDLYTCSQCQKQLKGKNCYDRHMRMHTDAYLYCCSFCGKLFHSNWNKKAHERQHTGEKPYSCSKCGMGFTHNVVRKTHEAKCDPKLTQK